MLSKHLFFVDTLLYLVENRIDIIHLAIFLYIQATKITYFFLESAEVSTFGTTIGQFGNKLPVAYTSVQTRKQLKTLHTCHYRELFVNFQVRKIHIL